MSDQEMLRYVRRLDYLYTAMIQAKADWLREGSVLRWRRLLFCKKRYESAKANPPRRRAA